ncbi:hypothetical protein BDY19DRAFT_541908 [Irpex rosettiformis]|uniref:Uncharacterized protein n=1 Tax=Irpex rosettiformis TaxID=378272 RepID=A0ACB8TQQ1_9APHY|nr:hypothetical protein BDY19DRAFT_541908 [Irpex rosettiformis]
MSLTLYRLHSRLVTLNGLLHTLCFFAVPRVMPMTFFHKFTVDVYVEDIHFTHSTMLFNLLQDCKLLHPRDIYCRNLTWDHDPTATLPSFGWVLAHRSHLQYAHHSHLQYAVYLSQCTDNALAAAMALNVPRHESFRRPHLNTIDSSSLVDIIRASWGQDASAEFEITSLSGFDNVQGCIAAQLAPDCDLAFRWWRNGITFYCIASRRPGDDINIRYATHIIIQPYDNDRLTLFMEQIKTIDWDVLLRSVQKFPDLRGIVIQCHYMDEEEEEEEEWRKCLVEFVSLLREAWGGVDSYLQLYHDTGDWMDPKWTQIPLSSVLEDIKRTRELEEAAMNSLGPVNPESNVEAESPASDSHNDNNLASDS